MGRLDKTFKPKLNEDFGEELPASVDVNVDLPSETEPEVNEKTPEEKLEMLTDGENLPVVEIEKK